MNLSHLFIHSCIEGTLSCFHLLLIMNSAALNIHVQVFFWKPICNTFGRAWSYDNSLFDFVRNSQIFSTMAPPFDISKSNIIGSHLFHILINNIFCSLPPILLPSFFHLFFLTFPLLSSFPSFLFYFLLSFFLPSIFFFHPSFLYPFLSLPLSFPFSPPSPSVSLIIAILRECEVISHCDFDLHFPND